MSFLMTLALSAALQADVDNFIKGAMPGYSEVKVVGCAEQSGGMVQCRIHGYKGSTVDVYTVLCGKNDGCRQTGLPEHLNL